jgi:hypothetical protein
MFNKGIFKIYGISQNPDTSNYILVQNDFTNLINWISGNETIDDFIQEMLNKNTIFEWIPYNQFNEIREIGKNNSKLVLYSAIWKDGPFWFNNYEGYTRYPNKEVVLKSLQNSQNTMEFLINEVQIL